MLQLSYRIQLKLWELYTRRYMPVLFLGLCRTEYCMKNTRTHGRIARVPHADITAKRLDGADWQTNWVGLPGSVRHMRVRAAGVAGSSPRLAEVRRFSHIAHGTRTGGRSRVRTVRYCLYDVYTARMHRGIAPVRVPTALATLQSHRHTQDDTDTAHSHALQMCSVRQH